MFEALAEDFATTFFFFSNESEQYLGPSLRHEPGDLPVKHVSRIAVMGNPLLPGLAGELSTDSYDVVIKCINGRLMTPYVYSLTRLKGLPMVLWTGIWHHPESLAHKITRPLVNHIYRRAEAIVVYGDHVKQHVTSTRGVEASKTFVAGQAINVKRFCDVKRPLRTPPRALFVGRLEEEKGIFELLTAFERIRDSAAQLRIIGAGTLESIVRNRAQSDRRIEFLGPVPNSLLPTELASTRCLVLPSVTTSMFREPWGLVVNEAMAAGVPVVATDAVGAAAGGLLRSGRNGMVVPERNPTALAAALSSLLGDAALADSLGAQGREDVEAFTYMRMTRAFDDAINHAMLSR